MSITEKGNWDSVSDILEDLKDKIERYFKFEGQSKKKKQLLALQQQEMDVYSAGRITWLYVRYMLPRPLHMLDIMNISTLPIIVLYLIAAHSYGPFGKNSITVLVYWSIHGNLKSHTCSSCCTATPGSKIHV